MEEIERKGDWHILFHRHRWFDHETVLHWLVTYLADSMDLIKRVVEIYERFGMPNMLWVEDKHGTTAVEIAARDGKPELVKFFISKCEYFGKLNVLATGPGYDLQAERHLYPSELTPYRQFRIVMYTVQYAVMHGEEYKYYNDIADYLLEFFQDRDVLWLLVLYVRRDSPHNEKFDSRALIYVLMRFDVDFLNGKHFGGFTALQLAAMHWHDEVAKELYFYDPPFLPLPLVRQNQNIGQRKLAKRPGLNYTTMEVIEQLARVFRYWGKESYINTLDPHGRTALDIMLQDSVRLRKNAELLKFEGMLKVIICIPTHQHQYN